MIRTLALMLVSAAMFSIVRAPACGPWFATAVFEPRDNPPAPDEYARGRLGIVHGSYRIPHLVTAWRVLSGKPSGFRPPKMELSQTRPETALDQWLKARTVVTKNAPPVQISTERRVPGQRYQWYPNCLDNAFESAASTLGDRVKRFGAAHGGVIRWVKAQDTVFANCAEGSTEVDPPEPGIQPLLAADRQYQTASALFYAGEFGKARNAWLEISKDEKSPWKGWAPYLAARCLVRQATLGEPDKATAPLQKAEEELKALTSGSGAEDMRRSAAQMAEWIATKLRPLDQMAVYARRLEGDSYDPADLDNLIHLWIVLDNSTFKPGGQSELLDWLFAMRGRMEFGDMVARWSKEKSAVWFVAALQGVKPGEPDAAGLLDAAAEISADSTAFATAAWARVRLAGADPELRRTLLDDLLPKLRRTLPDSALNWFVRERFAVARDFDDFVTFAPRHLAAEGIDGLDGSSSPQSSRPNLLLDHDGAAVLNLYLPLSRWKELLKDGNWTPHLRERLIRAGFVRAVTAGDEKTALDFASRLRTSIPAAATLFAAYEGAASPDTRRFAAAWALLKLPGLKPEFRPGFDREEEVEKLSQYRDNWWTAFETSEEKPPPAPGWITKEELARAEKERTAGGGALPFVTPIVVAWAEKNPSDPRAAEALAMVVRASRYGGRDQNTGRFSNQAYTLLHRKFPDSRWAKQTPFWYGNEVP